MIAAHNLLFHVQHRFIRLLRMVSVCRHVFGQASDGGGQLFNRLRLCQNAFREPVRVHRHAFRPLGNRVRRAVDLVQGVIQRA